MLQTMTADFFVYFSVSVRLDCLYFLVVALRLRIFQMGCDKGNCAPYCAAVPEYPCVAGKGYHGRGQC